jgi:flagellar basal-body rod protein FlgF
LNYGLQISASGVLTSMHRTDVLAANLANMDTVGFKPTFAGTLARDPVRVEDGVFGLPSNKLIERLGAGVLAAPTRTSFAQGPVTPTGRDLDAAIRGDGFFMVGGQGDALRLTRDGQFTRNGRGELVATASGLPVLDTAGRPVVIGDRGVVQIDRDGTVTRDGAPVARLGIARFADPQRLTREGANLFAAPGQQPEILKPGETEVLQGHTEGSGVDEIKTMMDLTSAAQAISSNLGMVQYHDRLMDRAINTLGRVS